MAKCVAVGCQTRSVKGVKLHRFPRDAKRRKIWAEKVRRQHGWKPNDYSYLCDKHFDDSQRECKRADGKALLKPNAVPNVFKYITECKNRQILRKRITDANPDEGLATKASHSNFLEDHTYCFTLRCCGDSSSEEPEDIRTHFHLVEPEPESHHVQGEEEPKAPNIKEPEVPHIKEEQQEVDIPTFPLTVIVKSEDDNQEEGDGDHLGGSQADSVPAPPSNCDDVTPRSSDAEAEDCEFDETCHTYDERVKCGQSDKCFFKKSFLKRKRAHAGEKHFAGSDCNLGFSERSELVLHTRSQTGNKQFSWSVCSERLKGHLITRTL
ncbi:peroxynitrite isomerase THAP4-like [Syngnathus typhle]|uniref:peroxynitrite isomerase THAP4-like n=1 Tax=Syngnathus typhle TaxID=161592 RepID=UPI002A6B3F34|nr:peroxynitrite isomerase THAP4-like [Syngnathus typhle]